MPLLFDLQLRPDLLACMFSWPVDWAQNECVDVTCTQSWEFNTHLTSPSLWWMWSYTIKSQNSPRLSLCFEALACTLTMPVRAHSRVACAVNPGPDPKQKASVAMENMSRRCDNDKAPLECMISGNPSSQTGCKSHSLLLLCSSTF